jgi:LysR family transcriptional regulator, benzoate and cis,cis-muconate-responsive activator of ben and cat genes
MPKRISFKNLEVFLALSKELNVSRAAAGLNIAQPALSQQIRLIEDRIGTTLFERSARPMRLTAAGLYLQAEAASLVERFGSAVAEARQIGEGHKGWLGLGFTRSAMYGFLPPVVRRFRQQHPNVELRLHEMLTEYQPDALRAGSIHLGIARDPAETPGLAQEVLVRERLVVALPRRHRLAPRRTVKIAELADEPFILFPKNPGARFPSRVLAFCLAAGFTPHIAQETFEIQTALGLVAAGIGVTLVTAGVAKQGRPDLVFRPLGPREAGLETLLVALHRPEPCPAARPGGPGPDAPAQRSDPDARVRRALAARLVQRARTIRRRYAAIIGPAL